MQNPIGPFFSMKIIHFYQEIVVHFLSQIIPINLKLSCKFSALPYAKNEAFDSDIFVGRLFNKYISNQILIHPQGLLPVDL